MAILTRDFADNNAWYRQLAAGWARRMMAGDSPGAWALNTETEIQFAVEQLGLRPGDRILDLGCGWGRHSLPLARYGLQVTGLDLSHDLLMLARYNAKRAGLEIDWIEGDVCDASVPGELTAIVQFCGNFMTWFSSREETLAVVQRVAQGLRPGGFLLFGSTDWKPELPSRSQEYDEWQGGAAIYRNRFDGVRRIAQKQMVVFGPGHERQEFVRETWWPTQLDMEIMFAQAGLTVCERFNSHVAQPYDESAPGLVYVLQRTAE